MKTRPSLRYFVTDCRCTQQSAVEYYCFHEQYILKVFSARHFPHDHVFRGHHLSIFLK